MKAMTTVKEWVDYLKWYLEILHRERETHIRISFAFGTVFIGSILAIAGGIHSTDWPMLILGIVGTVTFGLLLYSTIKFGNDVTRVGGHMHSILSDVVIGKLKDSNEILIEYRRVLDKMSEKYKHLRLRSLRQSSV